MPTEREKEISRNRSSGLASNRLKARDMEVVDAGGGLDDISATTRNRVASQAAGRAGNATRAAQAAKSPIGQFQERMRTGANPLADAAGAATAVASLPDATDGMGLDSGAAWSPAPVPPAPATDTASRAAMARLAPQEPGVTSFQVGPRRRIGMGRQDEQMLEALGPEYAAEAQRLASAESATPAPMTATINGQSFVGQPGQRVSRQALATGVNRIAMEKLLARQQQEQQAKFGQEQAMARIPGQSAVDLAKTKGDYASRDAEADRAFRSPGEAARVAQTQGQTAAAAGAESRTQKAFDIENEPGAKERAAADQAIQQIIDSGRANTPEGRQAIAVLNQLGSVGSRLPAEATGALTAATSGAGPAESLAAVKEFTADPQVAKLIQDIQANKPGMFPSADRSGRQAASRKALDAYINNYAAAKGIDPAELRTQIESQLVGAGGNSVNSAIGSTMQGAIPGGGLLARYLGV